MTFNQELLKYIFIHSSWVNSKFISNSIVISDFEYDEGPNLGPGPNWDILIVGGKLFVLDDVSEYIDGQIIGGIQYDNLDFDLTSNYAFINKEGESWAYPEYKFSHWSYDEGTSNLFIQDEDNKWYSLGKKTNYKLIKQ